MFSATARLAVRKRGAGSIGTAPLLMKQYPLWVRALLACGLSPQKTLLCLADLFTILGTALVVFLVRAAFGDVDSSQYRGALPLLLMKKRPLAPSGLRGLRINGGGLYFLPLLSLAFSL